MNLLDMLLLAMMAIGFIIGFKVGAVRQISFGAGIGIGLLQAIVMYPKVSFWIYDKTEWANWLCNTLAFILIMAAVIAVVHLAGKIITAILEIFYMRLAERIIGALFYTYIAVLLLASIVHISDRFSPDDKVLGKTSQRESVLYKEIVGKSIWVIEEAKKELTTDEEEQYIEETCEQSL
jgi:uncharacterized membrane protein required for colicin V production